jgi:O-methyltransferase involved in polyketide biosynthesis
VARTRLIDDWVGENAAAGARQVVLLGAGFDCRALRLPNLAKMPIFEGLREVVWVSSEA